MRKVNSILVVVIVLMFVRHSILSALYLAGILNYRPDYVMTGRRLFIVICIHILISLGLMLKDIIKRRGMKIYSSLLKETRIQVTSGILIIFFMVFHVILYSRSSAVSLPGSHAMIFMHVVVDVVFFTALMAHLTVSIPKLFISLGVITEEERFEKAARIVKYLMVLLWIGYFGAEMTFYVI